VDRLRQRLYERLRPRSAGLRLWLSLSYGLLAVVLVGALSVLVEHAASAKLQRDIGLRLSGTAAALADRLDEGLYERLSDMRAMSIMPGLDAPMDNQESLRGMFSLMQRNYPEYAWIGVTDADGRILIASRGLLEGLSVAERPWFRAARREPYLGDIREAVLLADLLPRENGRPTRLIDVASPIHDDFGRVTGVIGAHLSWNWAESLRQSMMQPQVDADPVEVFVVNREGKILLGPEPWRDQALDVPSVQGVLRGERGSVRETWPDGRQYLTGFAPTVGRDAADGLGWSILVRKDSEVAFASIAELRRQILLVAIPVALVFVLVARFPDERGYREARQLTAALRGMVDELTLHERELVALAQQLEQRVRDRTLELSEANAQLEVLAMTDALTGLANRRHFGDQLAREVSRAASLGKPVALVTLDIDHFKRINDQHGHPAGDAVLRRVAMLLEEQVRGSDLLARVGGEEFAVLAVESAVTEASQLGERLRAAVEAAGQIVVGRAAVSVTISVGVAVIWPRAGDILKAPERLLAGADDALYRAKRNGRNRVEVAAP
jgi:diguanylate cyclase (GGDEF)-like protein